ncbi:MAG: hypothetical protein ABFD86_04280, partial [Bryobacteraceae bacterium]
MKRLQLAAIVLVSALATGRLCAETTFNPNPSRIVGHPQLTLVTGASNLVEGREFNSPQGIAADTSVTPPILYVADTGNNRILAWRNAATFANGAFADLVIGQASKYATSALGPSTSVSTGMTSPTGIAVDAKGNLYVADSGNNRILRFPKPFEQPADSILPDMVIGQNTFSANSTNQGLTLPSAKTLALNQGSSYVYRSGLAFDSQGNLYASDPGNHRVLRYPTALLDYGSNGPAADMVLGQVSFDAKNSQVTGGDRRIKGGLANPSGLALDQAGRLFVCDALNRVLVYTPPYSTGKSASRVMGVVPDSYVPSNTSLGAVANNSYYPPEGVFTIGYLPFVIDTYNSRILRFSNFDSWPAETPTVMSPAASGVIGQVDFNSTTPNRGLTEPNAFTLAGPIAAAYAGGMLFVADSDNHRVLVFSDPSNSSDLPSFAAQRVLGQDGFQFDTVNLIEGREFRFNSGGGIAVDAKSDPPRLYVADTGNNRILGFKDARKVRPGQKADLVIGQGNDDYRFQRSLINYPTDDSTKPNQFGLNSPMGLAVDSGGNLWVADYGNGRVLRFPTPFQKQEQAANMVLGQTSFTSQLGNVANMRTLYRPFGVAFSNDGSLAVSDMAHNRVLLFQNDPTKGFQNGQSAAKVYGQIDAASTGSGPADNKFNSPRGIAFDTGDRLYVCDRGNYRVSIFGAVWQQPTFGGSAAESIKGLSQPQGVFVSRTTGAIWIADPGNTTQLRRWPSYDNLYTGGYASNGYVYAATSTAVTMDGFDNLLAAEATNRVDFFFPALTVTNAANYSTRATAGMIGSIWPAGNTYGSVIKSFNELANPLPLPTTLADIQVLVNDSPAPLFFVSPGQINFQMPSNIADSGTVEVQVVNPSKDQILGAQTITVRNSSPALFTNDGSGGGQVAALNQDNSRNSPTNRAKKDQVIQLFGTGPGKVPNSPPDGTLSSGLVPTEGTLQVSLDGIPVEPKAIEYTGLAPGLVGVWQINVRIPKLFVPVSPNAVIVLLQYRNTFSLEQGMKVTTIAVEP